ncbi:hypothetical protein CC86DRAFT_107472 [Ophiobolus disseminans]|uniref:Uncharacterized protein n=1 Tax=Ophiobolus disseminans TaxID=1469910 RepID=A0A6A6ZL98_9PLEO|nr:hypothetical protein CC86DRAFT_107472 [Ophiobolus disseminans]
MPIVSFLVGTYPHRTTFVNTRSRHRMSIIFASEDDPVRHPGLPNVDTVNRPDFLYYTITEKSVFVYRGSIVTKPYGRMRSNTKDGFKAPQDFRGAQDLSWRTIQDHLMKADSPMLMNQSPFVSVRDSLDAATRDAERCYENPRDSCGRVCVARFSTQGLDRATYAYTITTSDVTKEVKIPVWVRAVMRPKSGQAVLIKDYLEKFEGEVWIDVSKSWVGDIRGSSGIQSKDGEWLACGGTKRFRESTSTEYFEPCDILPYAGGRLHEAGDVLNPQV